MTNMRSSSAACAGNSSAPWKMPSRWSNWAVCWPNRPRSRRPTARALPLRCPRSPASSTASSKKFARRSSRCAARHFLPVTDSSKEFVKTTKTIFQDGSHKWVAIVRDPEKPNYLIDTNEYLVAHGDQGLLLDPGGAEIFPAVFSALSAEFDPSAVTGIFASHQDPDTVSSLALWLEFNPDMRCYVSWLWSGFIPHFGGTGETLVAIPDAGMDISLAGLILKAVPAHYLHSSGNVHLYDKVARILFSGDVGAALLPAGQDSLFVEDFDAHIRHAEAFHKRW